MAFNRELKIDISDSGDDVEIKLSGVISEISVMAPEEVPAGRRVVIDAAEVANINSMGVRTWIGFINGLCDRSQAVVVQRMSWVLVWQASMIRNFLASAQVESFFSPWICPSCDSDHLQLHQRSEELPESIPCPKCGAAMELDAERESFMAFRGN